MSATTAISEKTRTAVGAPAKANQTDTAAKAAASAASGGEAGATKVEPVRPDQCSLAHFVSNRWRFLAPPNTEPSQIESPDFCSLVARDLNRLDDVRVVATDGSWYAEAVVAQTWSNSAQLRVLHVVNIGPESDYAQPQLPSGYSIRQSSVSDEQRGFLVVRDSDCHVMNLGNPLNSHHDARAWLMNHPAVAGNINANGIWRG